MIKVLLKARFAAMLSAMLNRKKGKKSIGMVILFAFLYLYLGAVFTFLFASTFFGLGAIFLPAGEAWFYFTMMIILAFSMMLFGSVFLAKSQLFEAKDNDLLLAMPIRPRDLLISRMLYLLILNYLYEAIVVLPAAVVWVLFGGGSVFSWLALSLTALCLPFLCLALSCLLAWLISLLTAKLPKKNIFTLVLFMVFFIGYFYFVSNMENLITAFAQNKDQISQGFRSVTLIYWLGSAIGNGNLLHLLFTLALYILPFILACVILSKTFVRIVTSKSGTSVQKSKRELKLSKSSVLFALLKREYARLFSSTTYLLNSGIGIPMALIVTVALVLKKNDLSFALELLPVSIGKIGDLMGLLMTVALVFLNGMALFTAPSVSLEGKHFYLLRSLPAPTKDILRAKLALHLSLMLPMNLICSMIIIIAVLPSFAITLMLITVPTLFAVWCANIGLICNLHHPVLDWNNEAQVVKQGISVLLTMLFCILPMFVLGILGIVLAMINIWLAYAAVTVLLLMGDALTYRYLMRGGVKRFENIL